MWALENSPRLPATARQGISAAAETYVSVASVWELEIKRSLGKLSTPDDLPEALADGGYRPLAISLAHAVAAARLPQLHRNPFDRVLVAQAIAEGLTIVTRDTQIARYGVATLWE